MKTTGGPQQYAHDDIFSVKRTIYAIMRVLCWEVAGCNLWDAGGKHEECNFVHKIGTIC